MPKNVGENDVGKSCSVKPILQKSIFEKLLEKTTLVTGFWITFLGYIDSGKTDFGQKDFWKTNLENHFGKTFWGMSSFGKADIGKINLEKPFWNKSNFGKPILENRLLQRISFGQTDFGKIDCGKIMNRFAQEHSVSKLIFQNLLSTTHGG